MLVKWGNFDITPYIVQKGYHPIPNRRTDVDSYQDSNTGELHRTTLEHTRSTISIEVAPMFERAHAIFMKGITDNYISRKERNANVEYYDTEYCKMENGLFYIDSNQDFGTVDKVINGQNFMTGFTLELTEY